MFRHILAALVLCGLCQAEGVWVEQPNPFSDSLGYMYTDVCFVDSMVGYALLNYGQVVKTMDGGVHWEVQVPPRPGASCSLALNHPLGNGIVFIDSLTGWITRSWDHVSSTRDGGKTWFSQDNPSAGGTWHDVEFADVDRGWTVGRVQPGRSIIAHTDNGGETWRLQDSLGYSGLYGVCFLDSLKGFAVGDSGTLLCTLNGGAHWEQVAVDSGTGTLYDVQFADASHGLAVGDRSCLRTVDGGQTWQKSEGWSELWNECDVAFPDSLHAWTTGVYFSSDMGRNWQHEALPAGTFGISFPDTSHGWAVGGALNERGRIFRYVVSAGLEETHPAVPPVRALEVRPNPSRGAFMIGLVTPRRERVAVVVYDAGGKFVRALADGLLDPGHHAFTWDGRDAGGLKVPSGVYFCQTKAGHAIVIAQKVVLLH